MKILKTALISVLLMYVFSACVPAPLILAGASGGAVYSSTTNSVKDVFNISKEQAFETMIGIIAADDGHISVSSIADGRIEAKIGKSLVVVTIKPINDQAIEVTVRAHKYVELLPDKETAVKYYRAFVNEVVK